MSGFLKSTAWAKIKVDIYFARDKQCERCGKNLFKYYHVHHLCYDRYGGAEEPADLILVCGKCHQKIHGIKKKRKRKKKRKW